MTRATGILWAVLLCGSALAQGAKPVKITFPSEGDREVWIGPAKDPGLFKDPVAANGTSITLDAPADPAGWVLYAHDKKSGNVAEKLLAEAAKTGEWKVLPTEERRVFRMEFHVTGEGSAPVSSAVLKAKIGAETREALLTPADKGLANLYNLPAGTLEVVVQYKTGEATKTTPPQSFEVKLGSGVPAPKTITIADKVETIPEESATKPADVKSTETKGDTKDAAKPREREQVPAPNPGISFLNLIIGLAVIGGICYGIYSYVKKNPKQVEDVLKKAGLGDQQAQIDSDLPPAPAQPQPIKPIVLGDAAPAAALTPIASTSAAVANPRLVRPDGSIVLLSEGASTVGREAPAEIVLDGESSVSRQHARLERTGDAVTLSDAGSTNGTFVNGVRLTGPVSLKVGDSVQFGAVAFRYEE
ncbi:MAG: FHA domain-containing protein [Armatimonadetes bacterium]|nr:FHA domain-containing protein [Armatimonadota bacterium]